MEWQIPYNLSPVIGACNKNKWCSVVIAKGYLVSNEGEINIPVLGTILVKGLTYTQIEEKIQKGVNRETIVKIP